MLTVTDKMLWCSDHMQLRTLSRRTAVSRPTHNVPFCSKKQIHGGKVDVERPYHGIGTPYTSAKTNKGNWIKLKLSLKGQKMEEDGGSSLNRNHLSGGAWSVPSDSQGHDSMSLLAHSLLIPLSPTSLPSLFLSYLFLQLSSSLQQHMVVYWALLQSSQESTLLHLM